VDHDLDRIYGHPHPPKRRIQVLNEGLGHRRSLEANDGEEDKNDAMHTWRVSR